MVISCLSLIANSPFGGCTDGGRFGGPVSIHSLHRSSRTSLRLVLGTNLGETVGQRGIFLTLASCGCSGGCLGRSRSSRRLLYLLSCVHDGDRAKGSVLLGRELLKELTQNKSVAALPFKSTQA